MVHPAAGAPEAGHGRLARSRVEIHIITTIQRLYSVLTGNAFAEEDEERSGFERGPAFKKPPLPITYNAAVPPEFFDVVACESNEKRADFYPASSPRLPQWHGFSGIAGIGSVMTAGLADYIDDAQDGSAAIAWVASPKMKTRLPVR